MTATTTTKRHPIRGFFYGIFFGLGLAMLAIGQGWAALGTWPPFLLFIVGLVVGTLWSTFGPAKKPKGAPPADFTDEAPPEPPTDDDDTAAPPEEIFDEIGEPAPDADADAREAEAEAAGADSGEAEPQA